MHLAMVPLPETILLPRCSTPSTMQNLLFPFSLCVSFRTCARTRFKTSFAVSQFCVQCSGRFAPQPQLPVCFYACDQKFCPTGEVYPPLNFVSDHWPTGDPHPHPQNSFLEIIDGVFQLALGHPLKSFGNSIYMSFIFHSLSSKN